MRILWNSSTPIGYAGYSIITREVVRRLKDMGHFVRVATKHAGATWQEWEGIEICDGNLNHMNRMIKEEGFDYIFSNWDIWVLDNHAGKPRYPKDKWVGYVPVDTEKISKQLANVAKDVGMVIAYSKHGKRELESVDGVSNVIYAPPGINTKVFKPNPKGRKAVRDHFGWGDDIFVIGSVGLNYPDDRKGFIPLLRAFKKLNDKYPNTRLYLHTHMEGKAHKTLNYLNIIKELGIRERVACPDQMFYDLGRIDDNWLAEVYNAFDVFCLPTLGEGFGLPLIEAQACGVPVITTDVTTGPELVGDTGWIIPVYEDDTSWMPTGTWRAVVRPSEVFYKLDDAYITWEENIIWGEMQEQARLMGQSYAWDKVWKKYWIPVLAEMKNRLNLKQQIKEKMEKENPDMEFDVVRMQ